ncbi:sigma-70 family RNA polymerase sigma factor [Sporosarcina highlanderae]|uniref:Sigma-70 family RNA polymerase sigma factor n=1 Tax=Sporosarcina highlanderae TaxID=3035916 RepID=A0ABT8JM47_9BACL|nr:sigma-70 family RNA polymerase sigma factor [Sporosarcina highlanderae]MDN4606228.1 sigma-70 family RNA polymerase sigma factor [Sporosarcina highlanderae]
MQIKGKQLESLYRQYARSLYFYLLKLSGSKQLAEDLTQETFIRATINLQTYEDEEARAWLFKVARNAYLDEWRKQQRRRTIPLFAALLSKTEMISPYGIPEESLLAQEQNEQLEDLLNYLPEHYRSIIYLREYEQFSYKEISESLQLTQDQVKVTLYRARKRLADLFEKKGWQYDGME